MIDMKKFWRTKEINEQKKEVIHYFESLKEGTILYSCIDDTHIQNLIKKLSNFFTSYEVDIDLSDFLSSIVHTYSLENLEDDFRLHVQMKNIDLLIDSFDQLTEGYIEKEFTNISKQLQSREHDEVIKEVMNQIFLTIESYSLPMKTMVCSFEFKEGKIRKIKGEKTYE